MEKREDKKKSSAYMQTSRNCHTYKKNNLKKYYNKHLDSFSYTKLNKNRDKRKIYNYKLPYLMHVKPQNIRIQCPKEVVPWSDEAVELERKQQVSDTAKKLLDKLKMWNTETNEGKDYEWSKRALPAKQELESKQKGKAWKNSKINKNLRYKGDKSRNVNKNNTSKLMENHKHLSTITSRKVQSRNISGKFPGGSSENKQKKIQENIIGELMEMPKENLSRVLINPKIHPKFEKKVAQIVRENRLLLAQKFRHLAESKINSHVQFQFQSKFIDDVENLINPDLAIDLCQLPPELIKQMGDIFQMDFNSCMENTEIQESTDSYSLQALCEDSRDEMINFSLSSINGTTVLPENRKNIEVGKVMCQFSVTEGSFFPNFHNYNSGTEMVHGSVQNDNKRSNSYFDSDSDENQFLTSNPASNILIKEFISSSQSRDHSNKTELHVMEKLREYSSESTAYNRKIKSGTKQSRFGDERKNCSPCLENKKFFKLRSSEVQTDISLIDLDHFMVFQRDHDLSEQSFLLEEVNLIDNLIHALNRRRFLLFLKLVNLNSCKSNNSLRKQLVQVVTNFDQTVLKNKKKLKKVD